MSKDCVVYVRTDAREFNLASTIEALAMAFPKKKMEQHLRPYVGPTQTALFGDKDRKPGEVDLILH